MLNILLRRNTSKSFFKPALRLFSSTSCSFKSSKKMSSKIVWMDLEMTGLDVVNDKILEVSCLISDKDLNIVAESNTLIINYSDDVLTSMNPWSQEHHGKSGLTEACMKSSLQLADAEDQLLSFLKNNIDEKACPLAGNSIYMDRIFLRMHMPRIDDYLHYRIIDVSSIKELCKRWNPPVFSRQPKKKLAHRSLDDIKESIDELKFYRENFIISK